MPRMIFCFGKTILTSAGLKGKWQSRLATRLVGDCVVQKPCLPSDFWRIISSHVTFPVHRTYRKVYLGTVDPKRYDSRHNTWELTGSEHMRELALLADVGGTNTRVALVDETGAMLIRQSESTQAEAGRDAVMERLATAIREVASTADASSIVGIGLSVASPVDPATGEMYNPPNLHGEGWHLFSPKTFLQDKLGLPVSLANDATLGAMGEHAFGAGRGSDNMIYLTLSTGIGGGVIMDGRLYTGHKGFAGEIGHITIDRNGPTCNCGNVGCLEAMASGTAVARMAYERLSAGESSTLLAAAGGDASAVDARMVAEAAKSGDKLAQSLMSEVGTNLGIGIVSLMHVFDPELIVIGGGMSQNLEMLIPEIDREIQRHAMAHLKDRRPVVKSELGDDVSLLGAAALVFSDHRISK